MIIDVLPNQYEALAAKHTFRPWQTGLLGNMLSDPGGERCVNINMGSLAGHTHFARVLASSDFPLRTKVYLTRQEIFSEYSSLLFDEDKVHEPIELLEESTYSGSPIKFVLIDMSSESARRFKDELNQIMSNFCISTRIIILHADFSIY